MDIRGVYGFSSLMKQKIKAKIYAVFCFAGFFFIKNLCYELIVKQIFYKRSANHYCFAQWAPEIQYGPARWRCTASVHCYGDHFCSSICGNPGPSLPPRKILSAGLKCAEAV
jgi:hypothetical protein